MTNVTPIVPMLEEPPEEEMPIVGHWVQFDMVNAKGMVGRIIDMEFRNCVSYTVRYENEGSYEEATLFVDELTLIDPP